MSDLSEKKPNKMKNIIGIVLLIFLTGVVVISVLCNKQKHEIRGRAQERLPGFINLQCVPNINIDKKGKLKYIKCSPTPFLSSTKITFNGLSAVNSFSDEIRTGDLFKDQTYSNPYITSVTFRTSWADVEPAENQFNWSKLDEVFTKAEQHGKLVDIILIPGFGTPSWAFEGVKTALFSIKYGKGKDNELLLPMPWDKRYLERWFVFLKEINRRYGNRASFRMISAAGPTSVSSEMSLPNTDPDICIWINNSYTSDKYIETWKEIFDNYATIFPNQYFSLALYPGLPIDANTHCIDNHPLSVNRDESKRVRGEIVSYGVIKYPAKFALQTSGLNPTKDDDEGAGYQLVQQYSSKVLTGFMMSSAFSNKEEKYGKATEALKEAIKRGLDANIEYLEIYEDDINNPNMQTVLSNAASRFNINY